jgi:LAS superfamily LD-carboxypeptidase LdcB
MLVPVFDQNLECLEPREPTPGHLVGQDETHLCTPEDAEWLSVSVHRDVVEPFREASRCGGRRGFDVAILSGFRNFRKTAFDLESQGTGELAVLDNDARPIEIATLTERELVFSILRWSALPGASRHHWGTDIDVFDAAARPDGYEIELIPSEYESGGMFAPFSAWLDERIANGSAFGFFRPYDRDRNGVAPERWHLSYAPLATVYARMLSPALLRQTIESADMMLKDVVLAHLDEIVTRFVTNTNPAEP